MNKAEALRRLTREHWTVPAGQEYTAGYFEPSDAIGIARLFFAIYGEGYPIDTYYIPERLVEENRLGNLRSVVARTAGGDVVSHVAFYRSSPPNAHLYEYGLGLTLPSYRSTMAFFRTTQLVMKLLGTDGIDGFFGEAVCNHVVTQKFCRHAQALETALEPALMPADAYETEHSAAGRVGCMVYARVATDHRRPLFLPAPYSEELTFLRNGLNLDRQLSLSDAGLPPGHSQIDVKRFDFAGVARGTITTPGQDLAQRVAELEQEVRKDDFALIQWFVNLGEPWSGAVVEQLRSQGFSLGGLLPIWFGNDGLLMQKHFVPPDFEGMMVFSQRGHQVRDLVRRDWEQQANVQATHHQ
jgi:hypothetical protein